MTQEQFLRQLIQIYCDFYKITDISFIQIETVQGTTNYVKMAFEYATPESYSLQEQELVANGEFDINVINKVIREFQNGI